MLTCVIEPMYCVNCSINTPCRTRLLAVLSLGCVRENSWRSAGDHFASGQRALERTYRLGIGDKLKITVFGEENLSGPAEVDAMGQVALPLAGEFRPGWPSINSAKPSAAAVRWLPQEPAR